AEKYVKGIDVGTRAVRWDSSGTAATELGNFGTDSNGSTSSNVYAINSAGTAVGTAFKYSLGKDSGNRAVLWSAGAVVIDLNELIAPNSGWTLTSSFGINDTNWVTGIGSFDPDGEGPLGAYDRAFLINVATVVPEPGSVAISWCAATLLMLRRRRGRRH